MVLPYTFPEKQTSGFDAQQTGHQMWRKVGRWMVPKNSPKLAVDLKSARPTGVKAESDSVHASSWTESFNLRSSKLLYNRLT